MHLQIDPVPQGLRLSGELTIQAAAQAKPALLQALTSAAPSTQLDLSRISEFDTAGLQLLLLARREIQAKGHTLTVTATSPVVYEVLTLCGALEVLADVPASEVGS